MQRRRFNLCAVLAVLLAISVLTGFTQPTTALAAAKVSLNATNQTI